MSSTSDRPTNEQTRTYDRANSVVFLKTDAPFGGLSNMAGGFPLYVQGTRIYTSEALYQACRFPHLPEVQRLIIGQASPMTAKMKSKPHRKNSRTDWDRVRVKVMRWCLRVKLAQNWAKFSGLLLRTGDRPIVEESRRDDFWGAKPVDEQTLVGMNVLGRLLMELREAVKAQGPAGFQVVEPLDIPEFLFLGRPIGAVGAHELGARDAASTSTARAPEQEVTKEEAAQGSLFDTPAAREGSAPAYITSPRPESTSLGDLKPYPAMKDSEVPWVGLVPQHWDVQRGKRLFRTKKQITFDQRNANVLSLTLRGVVNNDPSDPEGLVPKDYGTYQLFSKGDLVFKLIDLENLRTSRVGLVHEDGIMSPAYVRLIRAHEGQQRYFFHQYLDLYQRGIFNQLGAGVRSTLGPSDLLEVPVVVPPRDEQAAIVRFLDHADRRIRRYIRAKQKLIKLLEEQKQAIIHRAVTRGLDPNVRLKPSGVAWLGDVPEHWEVTRLKNVAAVQTGLTLGKDYRSAKTKRYPYLRVANVQTGRVDLRTVKQVEVPEAEARRSVLRAGDVLMTEGGDIDKLGRGCVWSGEIAECLHQNHVFAVRCGLRLLPAFLAGLMASNHGRAYFQTTAKQTTNLAATNSTTLRAFPLVLPDVAEQEHVLSWIATETEALVRAAADAEREIALLREYRTRLIADVVTGKLDVRDAAARLPQEAEDLEPLDDDADEADAGDTDELPEESEA